MADTSKITKKQFNAAMTKVKKYADSLTLGENGVSIDYDNTYTINKKEKQVITPVNDVEGNYFNCHGLGILYHNGMYYAYGESKTGETQNPGSTAFIPTTGVNCYSSSDLINWKFENKVIKPNTDDSNSIIHTSKVLERPKVIYNKKNNNFVMIFHSDNASYSFAKIGIAVSDTPTGDFNVIGAYRPAIDSTARDITVFVDDDETAYIFVSRDNNQSLYCHKLNDDYTGFTGEYSIVINSMQREAPAVFKYNNNYYIMTSGCTGWNPNPTKIYKSSDIMGTYQEDSIACLNDTNNNSYGSQPTFVLPVDENKTGYKFIAMFDKWNPSDLEKSSYLWLPMFLQNDKFYVDESINTINIDKNVLMTNISDKNNFFYNKSIEYAILYLYEFI